MKVKIYAHKDHLILVGNEMASENYQVPGDSQIGTLLLDCNTNTIGISKEALDILSVIKQGEDEIGEIDIFKAPNGKTVMGWLGNHQRLAHKAVEGSKTFDFSALEGKYTLINNSDAPADAIEAIEDFENVTGEVGRRSYETVGSYFGVHAQA